MLVQVSLLCWSPSQGQLIKANTIKAHAQVQEVHGLVDGLGSSLLCVTIQSSSTDFYHNGFPRAQNITEYVINLGMRKFPSNKRNNI